MYAGTVAGMMISMDNIIGGPDNGKLPKADTYKKTREYAAKFKEKSGTYYCRALPFLHIDRKSVV